MITRILTLLAAILCLAGSSAPAATPTLPFLRYDADTLLPAVPSPNLFWRSNFLNGAEITYTISGGRVTPVLADSITRDTELTAAIAALAVSINSGVPNGTGAKIHWSELLGVPAGFADGTDDGAGGGSGDVVGPASATDSVVVLFSGTTGKLVKNGTLTESAIATDAEVAAGYQPLDADLTDLADGTLTGSKVGTGINGDNVTSGTIAAARIDTAMATDAEVAAGYQPLDADLTDLADGSLSGSKVGSGINGDNVTSGTVAAARIDTAMATDAEVAAGYQPLDADLTDLADGSLSGSKVGSGIDDDNVSFDDADNVWTATTVGAALEEMNDSINSGVPNGTGAKVHWSQLLGVPAGFADGTDDGAGGGGGNASTNVAQGWSEHQTFNAPVTFNDDATFGDIAANSITPANPFTIPVGGTGASNAAQARVNLGLVPDVDVQAFRLALLQLAMAMTSDGHMPVRESGIVTNLASTAAGRALLKAVSATDARNQLEVGKLHQGAYDRATWNGVTNENPTLDAVSDVLEAMLGGTNVLILTVDTNYFTVSGGQLTLNANSAIPRWLGQFGINSFTNAATTTNVLLANWTISSNDVPNATGKYLDGALTWMLTNNAGGTANFHFTVKIDGVVVASVQRSTSASSTPELHGGRFHLIREGNTSASFVFFGERIAAVPSVGFGTYGGSGGDNLIMATNAACNWSSNVNLTIEMGQIAVGATNSAAFGMQRINASLYRP